MEESLEDKKKMEEDIFRREIEELISSPLGGLKEGEIVVPLPFDFYKSS